jgi:hypothetical protein
MEFKLWPIGSAAIFVCLTLAPIAKADMVILPDPQYFESFSIGVPFRNSTSYQFTGRSLGSFVAPCFPEPGLVCGQVDLRTTPDASVSASVSAYAGQLNSVEAEVAYYYKIVTPGFIPSSIPGDILIPLVVSGFASFTSSLGPNTSIGGQLQNFVGITVAGQGAHGGTVAVSGGSNATVGPNSFLLNVNAFAYVQNAISLKAFGTVFNNGDATPGTVTEFVDPVISFAPGFDSTGYAIEVSPGVANGVAAAGVPEPGTRPLAALALAVIGLLRRPLRIAVAKRMRTRLCRIFLAGGVLAVSGSAIAEPLTWDLTNIVFGDGTTVAGSFVFDADTSTFSALNMTTSGGVSVPATNSWVFNTNDPGGERNSSGFTGFPVVDALSADESAAKGIFLFSSLGPLLTDAGGTITLNHLAAGNCGDAKCQTLALIIGAGGASGTGQFTSAAASAPEPSMLILSGSALFLAALRRRFKRASW